mgnify:CR=1 FL=1
MDKERLNSLLTQVQSGKITIEQAAEELASLPYLDLGFARLDLHRALRTGSAEVIFCQGKTVEQVVTIFERLAQHHDRVMGTRATPQMAAAVQERMPLAKYDSLSRLLTYRRVETAPLDENYPYVLVACAGTADLPMAEEAAQTVDFMGGRVVRAYDIGVAGIHRLLSNLDLIRKATVIVSVAGMEGALTSVIGGLASCPVIGVPTSVGYGASFQGLAALLAMLNSCAPGVAVVNIDNGFGAGLFAYRILQQNAAFIQAGQQT